MSGGQRQRVAIARALAIQPAIILADEPTANLDKSTGTEILHLMQEINQKLKTTFIFSTHDQRVVDMANRLVRVEDGSIQELGVRRGGEWAIARVQDYKEPPGPGELAASTGDARASLGEVAGGTH
jgi:putative ABC transport system ATP-binding protein